MDGEPEKTHGRQPAAPQPPLPADADLDRRLQILSTEHWSLLASRNLSYSESFSRVGTFFSVLSAAVISLALIAQAGRFDSTFDVLAILILCIVLFVGIATVSRLTAVNEDDLRWVAGMNRIRHAYIEMHPELEPYFVSGIHDDLKGLLLTMGAVDDHPGRRLLRDIAHGVQTLPGMLSIIVAVVAGVLAALVALVFDLPGTVVVTVGVVAGLLTFVALVAGGRRSFLRFTETLESRFPHPPS